MRFQEIVESKQSCPHCGGPMFNEMMMMEKKDACYYKVKASAKVWPSAYASGRLVQCRKKGAGNYGNKNENVREAMRPIPVDDKGNKIKGLPPVDPPGKVGDPGSSKSSPKGVVTYTPTGLIHKSNRGDVTPRPRAVAEEQLDEKCWDGYQQQGMKNKGGRQVPNCVPTESVDEDMSRRGFLKGAGAAAVAGAAGGAKADWEKEPDITDPMTDEVIKKWKNVSNNGEATLKFLHASQGPSWDNRQLTLYRNGGRWIQPEGQNGFGFGRLRVDNNKPFDLRFGWMVNQQGRVVLNPVKVSTAGAVGGAEYQEMVDQILTAKQRILIDASGIGGGILEFRPNVKESVNQGVAEDTELAEEFDLIESIIEGIAEHNGVDAEAVWTDLESLTEDELYAFAVTSQLNEDWQKANKRDKTDGMSQKAVNAYRRENPGSKLKTAVTTKPSKLKKGGKASKRRKSYCSRSRGQMKMHSISCAKTPDKAICKARRRWNC